MDEFKVLFLAADPSDSARLRLGQELREIRENLQRSKYREKLRLESREAVRPGDITQAILDIEPQIIHFSGHGMQTGELCFENIQGKTQPVQPYALAALFELVSEQVRCVVLNACHSEIQAKAIAKHIAFVIGMNQAIGDRAAITFSIGFYKALGAGRSIEDAYKLARVELQLESIPEHSTPVFLTHQCPTNNAETEDSNRLSNNKSKRLEVMLPYLNYIQISLLHKFIENPIQSIDKKKAKSDSVSVLMSEGIIEKIVNVDAGKSLYQINELSRPVVNTFFEGFKSVNDQVIHKVMHLNCCEQEFLRYYLLPSPIGDCKLPSPQLSHNQYYAIDSLIAKGLVSEIEREVIKVDGVEKIIFRKIALQENKISILEKLVLKRQINCNAIQVDLDSVLWNLASGSGIPSS